LEGDSEKVLDRYCDLLSVGTVADVMPLTGENRYLIKYGLRKFAAGHCRPGFAALMAEAGVADKRPNAAMLGFNLAPRLNAAGRLGHSETAIRLLMTDDPAEAGELARELCRKNRERQELEMEIWTQQWMPGWTEARFADRIGFRELAPWCPSASPRAGSRRPFSLPTVMIGLDGDWGKGSCRSICGFNLFEALSACSDCLEDFGGHAMAAGLTIKKDKVDELRKRLADYYREHRPEYTPALEARPGSGRPGLPVSGKYAFAGFAGALRQRQPTASSVPGGALLEAVTPIGGGKHLRLRLRKFGRHFRLRVLRPIGRHLGALPGQRVDLVFTPKINEFRSRCSVQLIKDRPARPRRNGVVPPDPLRR
jgi:single-stranded-DNA-specific exonuclease